MCNHVANWQWTLNPINQWPVLLKLKQIQKKYSKKKYKQWKLLHLERFISLGLVSKKIQGRKLNNSSTFQGFHAVFKAQTKFKNFSSQGLKFKHFSNCCAPWLMQNLIFTSQTLFLLKTSRSLEAPPPLWIMFRGTDIAHLQVKIIKNYQNFKFWHFARNFTCNTPLKLLDKMYKYEMDPSRTVGASERTRDAGWMDRRSETNIPPPPHPPTTLLCEGYNELDLENINPNIWHLRFFDHLHNPSPIMKYWSQSIISSNMEMLPLLGPTMQQYSVALSCGQVSATHLKIRHLQSSNEM